MQAIEYTKLVEESLMELQSSRFRMLDKRIKYLIAFICATKKTVINGNHFKQAMNQVKQEADFFTQLDLNTRAILAVFLLINDKVNSRDIQQLFTDYKNLNALGYYGTRAPFFLSVILQLNGQEKNKSMDTQRVAQIYKQIKKIHPFFKGEEIELVSIFLALHPNLSEKTTIEILQLNEFYFGELTKIGDRKNNSLLLAAATATCWQAQKNPKLFISIHNILTQFKEMNIALKPSLYNTIVILACINLIQPLYVKQSLPSFLTAIYEQKSSYYQKEYNNEFALSLYLHSISNDIVQSDLISLSLTLTRVIAKEKTMTTSSAIANAASIYKK